MDIGPKGIGNDYRREEYTRARRLKGDFSRYFAEYESNADEEKKERPVTPESPEREGDQVELGLGSALTRDRVLSIYRERMLFELREFLAEMTGSAFHPADVMTSSLNNPAESATPESISEDTARFAYRVFGLARGSKPDADLKSALFDYLDRGLAQVQSILAGLSGNDRILSRFVAETDAKTRSLLDSIPG